MTDKEIMAAAAKAAGHELHQYHEDGEPVTEWRITCTIDHQGNACAPWHKLWQPLESNEDAEALRSALGIEVFHRGQLVEAWYEPNDDLTVFGAGIVRERYDGDKDKATRRVICLAAAAVWRATHRYAS